MLPLLAATMPEIPRVFQSCRSASSRLPISAADMMMMRRTFVLSGSSVTRTRSPIDSSATLTVTAFFRVFSPGATLCGDGVGRELHVHYRGVVRLDFYLYLGLERRHRADKGFAGRRLRGCRRQRRGNQN